MNYISEHTGMLVVLTTPTSELAPSASGRTWLLRRPFNRERWFTVADSGMAWEEWVALARAIVERADREGRITT